MKEMNKRKQRASFRSLFVQKKKMQALPISVTAYANFKDNNVHNNGT